jgi:N-acetylglucosamine-6-sulfatase
MKTLALLLSGLLAAAALTVATPLTPEAKSASPPNVVLIYADDMRLDDLLYMPRTRALFERQGLTFTNALSPHPLCCPARAELLTGQYAQNNGVHHNGGPLGGYHALTSRTNLTPQWFRAAGYRTAYIGKYLNGYRRGHVNGATMTDTLVARVYNARGVTSWNNGRRTRRRGHQTDWMAARTGSLVRKYRRGPFFIMASYVAPHAMRKAGRWIPPIPPADIRGFRDPSHRRPQSFGAASFNEADMSDKPASVQRKKVARSHVRRWHKARVLSLYALDRAVMRTVRALRRAGVYRNTILAFTSDNGYALGEHRAMGKNLPYREVLRVPLLMTGPGVPTGENHEVATLVDLPQTLATMAGVTPTREVDGIDLFTPHPDRAVLIQAGSTQTEWSWRGVFTSRYTYAEQTNGEVELYDRQLDPDELVSAHAEPEHRRLREQLHELYQGLEDCAGAGCEATFP